jgi:hypothetical protein
VKKSIKNIDNLRVSISQTSDALAEFSEPLLLSTEEIENLKKQAEDQDIELESEDFTNIITLNRKLN